jgi:hypothetical protein
MSHQLISIRIFLTHTVKVFCFYEQQSMEIKKILLLLFNLPFIVSVL